MNAINQMKTRTMIFAAAVATGLAMNTHADELEPTYYMNAVSDRAYGHFVSAGHYRKAIRSNHRHARRLLRSGQQTRTLPFDAATNLCVAYTMTEQLDIAALACDAAVKAAEKTADVPSPVLAKAVSDQAIAYSNRGVLRAVSGDLEGAQADFEMAINAGSGPESSHATVNLAKLQQQSNDTLAYRTSSPQ